MKQWRLVQPSVGQSGYFEFNNNTLRTSTNMESIVIAPGVLTQGVTYTLMLTLSDGNGNVYTTAYVTFTCAIPPTVGSVAVSPSSGTALQTTFVATASNFVSFGALKYRFSYVDPSSGSEVQLTDYSTDTFANVVLPAGNPLTLVCYAADVNGAESRATTTVVVSPFAIDSGDITGWQTLINTTFGDSTGTIVATTNVGSAVQRTVAILSALAGERAPKCNIPCANGKADTASGVCICPDGWNGVDCSVNSTVYEAKQVAREQLLSAFLVSANVLSGTVTDSITNMYISTLSRSATVFDEMDDTLYLLLLNTISRLLSKVSMLSTQAADDTTALINAVINKNYLKSGGSVDQTAMVYIQNNILPLYTAKVGNNLVVGERSSTVHKDAIGITVQKTTLGTRAQFSSDGFSCPKTFGEAALSLDSISVGSGRQLSSDNSVVVSVVHYNYDPHRSSLSTPSTLISTVVGAYATDSSGTPLKVSVPAGKYVQVVVPGNYQTNSSYDCQMWNTTAWDTKGCFSMNVTTTQVTCYCSAFGDVSVRTASVVAPVAAAGAGLWWLFFLLPLFICCCCCCCIIWIIIIIVLVVLKRRRDKKKEEDKMSKLDATNMFPVEQNDV